MNYPVLPRVVSHRLDAMLRVMPAVVVCGARQTGKTTLARAFGGRNTGDGPTSIPAASSGQYLSLDDFDVLDLARRDPDALVRGTRPVTLDEVQREPNLLGAVKREIDRDRRPGRFLMTGSANLLLMRRVSESLAGRAGYLTLWPMTRREQLGLGQPGIWEKLLEVPDSAWLDVVAAQAGRREDWRQLALRGGFPFPAVHLGTSTERAIWFDGYAQTYLERDLQALSSIAALPDFRRLMRAACLRLGSLVNQSDLGRDIGLPQPTAHRYLNLLETSYLLVRIPAYSVNRTKRLIKSPKLYWGDTGLAMHLSQEEEPRGAHLENLVLQDLLAWRDSRPSRVEVLHWRTTTNEEVDFVLEAEGALLPIEVKATRRPRLRDAAHLRTFRKEYGRAARAGLLLHDGDAPGWITPEVLGAPWWMVV
ncbi:MAG: ATP-binding protein [Gemmatimonadota bacterium]|nr:ATP-binding protein [Gemmatimonadota bacterium]